VTGRARELLDEITVAFEAARDPARAAPMRAYMKDHFAFLGIARPERDRLEKPLLQRLRRQPLTESEVDELARAAWEREAREYQYFALSVLRRHGKHLGPCFMDTAHHLITHRSWWDTVDELASHLVGPLVRRHPELVATLDGWIALPGPEAMWLRRTAILHQNRYGADTDQERLFRYCLHCAGETEFFIRKAIGWALRDHSRTAPAAVQRFVREHGERLSGLSRREALRHVGDAGAR
jgi:3-methyladenine DNA glycosylase AlkD